MKICIASPGNGTMQCIDVEDEQRIKQFFDAKIGDIIRGEIIGDNWAGYELKITGGSDKQGFPMRQGVLSSSRVSLLLNAGDIGFQHWRARKGERRRKTVRGCIVGHDIASLNVVVAKEGESKIAGLNTKEDEKPRRLGPKRASKLRKLFGLERDDDVRKCVLRRVVPAREGADGKKGRKQRSKAPKIQRLLTSVEKMRRSAKHNALLQRWARAKAAREAYAAKLHRMKSLHAERQRAKARRVDHAQKRAMLQPH